MTSRKRLAAVTLALGLASSALIASSEQSAHAATPACEGLVVGIDAAKHLTYRFWTDTEVTSEKKATVATDADSLVWGGSRQLDGGGVASIYAAFRYDQAAYVYDVVNKKTSPSLSVRYLRKYTQRFEGRLVTPGSGYTVYAVDDAGNLRHWTRYGDDRTLYLGTPKTVAKYMSGLKTLSYYWTIKIDGVYKDFLYGTTKTGKLLQFQIPTANPTAEKITKIADTGFAAYDEISLAACNNTGHYLAITAIDNEANEARLYTLPSSTTPKTYNLAKRGLIGVGADWNLHAVN